MQLFGHQSWIIWFFILSLISYFLWSRSYFFADVELAKKSLIKYQCNSRKVIWIMGVGSPNKHISAQYYSFVSAAINSAREKAPLLLPHLIHSGEVNDMPITLKNIPNVVFLKHNLSFIDRLIEYKENPTQFGAFYRIDIPLIMNRIVSKLNATEVDLEYVLYTDTDVLFFDSFDECSLPKPKIMYIGPDNKRGRQENSGVLYLNVSAFTQHLPHLLSFAESKKWHFSSCDQGLILEYFRDRKLSTLLPDKYNWKGYWGSGRDVTIAHFHTAKPSRCLECFLLYRYNLDLCGKGCETYGPFFKSSPDKGQFYEKMLITYRNYSAIPVVPKFTRA